MRIKEMAGDGVQPADLKRMGKADAKVYVHKDGKTILVPASKKDAYMAKGYKLSALRAEDDNSSRGGKEGFDYPQGGKYGYKAERGSGTGAMGTMQVNVTIHNRETDEIMNIKDMHYLELEKGEEQETLAMIWDENKDLIQKEDDNSSRGMNKYGLAARNKDGKFYSYRHGKLTGTFDNIKDLQKHQHDLIKDESMDQDTDESGIMYRAGVKKYGKDGMKKIQSAAGKGASAEEIGKIKDQHNKKKKESVQEDLAQMAQKVEQDHEVQMARSDLYKAAKYSIALHEMLKNVSEEQGIEGWVAAKITKASDYLSSVKHYMEYDMMESKQVTESMACNCDENCGCGGNCTSGCDCKPGCGSLDEGWLDDLKQMGYRFADEIKSLNDPALAAKLQADDEADLRTDNMVNDINTVHAMNRTPTDKGYDNETIVGYISKYVMPRHPALHNAGDFLKKMFPPGQNTDKNVLRGQLQKIAQMSQKVDVGQQQGQQQTASIDYKQSMHKKFEAKLQESKKKTEVLEDFVGKPITEEQFEKLAEKKDACYHKVKARYKVWPSAYASGALVQCRKKGAANWGNSKKK